MTEIVISEKEKEGETPFSPPFLATIKERYRLNLSGSDKETFHIVLDLQGSNIKYNVGDCLGIYPQNDPHSVSKLLILLGASGEEHIQDRKGDTYSLFEFLTFKASLLRIPEEKNDLQTFCSLLSPLLPRYYSIASAMDFVGHEAHLTVGLTKNSNETISPFGTCSHYLCYRAPVGEPKIAIFHKPSTQFYLPEEAMRAPIIMIGPGTGIAPFRGFMQQRMMQTGSSKSWLFFGERRGDTDFYYKDFWEHLVTQDQLRLTCAFSRSGSEKIYVQHKMREEGRELWEWIQKGAYVFVCGSIDMGKEVELTLQQLAEIHGMLSSSDSKIFIRNLRKSKKYLRDVY